jgi:hypothetical protein
MSETRIKLMEAIARKQSIAARYNGASMKLAPHLIFERHGDLFVSALNMDKAWRSDDERRLGQFKLAGLSAAELLDEKFESLPTFDGEPPRHGDVVVLAILASGGRQSVHPLSKAAGEGRTARRISDRR